MKYPCLILDHDDTVVNSTATVHFPCFVEFMGKYYPSHREYSLEEYFIKNFNPGILGLLRDEIGMSQEEMNAEHRYWDAYVQSHVPQAYDGMRELLWAHKRAGGLICVASWSYTKNILRDYRENDLPEPDAVFGWESPVELRKPNPYPVQQVMERFGLKPEEILVLDDLKSGYDMAKAAGVDFAAALWAHSIPEIQVFMRENCKTYFQTVEEFAAYLAK